MLTELWRTIPGATRYKVSHLGRVRRGDRILVLVPNQGYNRLGITFDDGKRRSVKASQAVAWAFLGPQEPGIQVRHLDGIRGNDHLSNLAYGTPSQNVQDSLRHGTNAQARKTHCKYGHELAGDNLMILSTRPKQRRCRECVYAANARWQAEKRVYKPRPGRKRGEAA